MDFVLSAALAVAIVAGCYWATRKNPLVRAGGCLLALTALLKLYEMNI